MRTTIIAAFAGLSATALAQSSVDVTSIYSVIATALPSSLVNEVQTDQAAFVSDINAQFATGTPSWFAALPTDVKSYISSVGQAALDQATGTMTGTDSSSATATGSDSSMVTSTAATGSVKSTAAAGLSSVTSAVSSAASSAASAASSAAGSATGSSTGAAPKMTMAAGLFGAAGLLGMLAL